MAEATFLTDCQRESSIKESLSTLIEKSWKKIPPFWTLQNLIAVNPLKGFEDLPFDEALRQGALFFEQHELPSKMDEVNRQSIKWLQSFFDQGQATFSMPGRDQGLYLGWKALAFFDAKLHQNNSEKKKWIKTLSENPEEAMVAMLNVLEIEEKDQENFLTLLLTTLPGWAAHVQYQTKWAAGQKYPVEKGDYLAFRLAITVLVWPEAKALLSWFSNQEKKTELNLSFMRSIEVKELDYRLKLVNKLEKKKKEVSSPPLAQWVFCIDVRSEPIRRFLESLNRHETFGFAGFFGVPITFHAHEEKEYHACPVLLKPKHRIPLSHSKKGLLRKKVKHLYQSLKYTFTTPCALAETAGFWAGLFMVWRHFKPKQKKEPTTFVSTPEEFISFEEQCGYAEGILRAIGLTKDFAPFVILCGHGGKTENNAFASSLDCGACGGHAGGKNAEVLSSILNRKEVREKLSKREIVIPQKTRFVAAEHNTTTDKISFFSSEGIEEVMGDAETAQKLNNQERAGKLGLNNPAKLKKKSRDWAEVRPEWGLAGNAAFIVGPREETKGVNLEGRTFLHSYDYTLDSDGEILRTILTAPMIVAQWINSQYFFSTYQPVSYGAGSKITKNVTGKIGVMQGNGSDLMHGLPFQSVYLNTDENFHEPLRLLTVVYAPFSKLHAIITSEPQVASLIQKGWISMMCRDPETKKFLLLSRNLDWESYGSKG
jgi:hypothetical protein